MNAQSTGKCPYCTVGVRYETTYLSGGGQKLENLDSFRVWTNSNCGIEMGSMGCPSCGRPILVVSALYFPDGRVERPDDLLWPETGSRTVPQEVEEQAPALATDFREAAVVLPKSKKASAALSRRCLQFVLQERGGTNARDLSRQIDDVLGQLPSQLAANLDAIRQIGNFAAHPMKSTNSGEIVDVEDGEAEWLLDVLEGLFDYYYVAPAKAAVRREALNEKLRAMGKPPLKAPQA